MNMQIAHLPMTQFWSTDSALRECPSPLGNMLMSEVKAEAVPCLQVGFYKYSTHSHTVMHTITHLRRDNTNTTVHQDKIIVNSHATRYIYINKD